MGNLISSGCIWNKDVSPRTCRFLLWHSRSTSGAQDLGGFGPNAGEARGVDCAASSPDSAMGAPPVGQTGQTCAGPGRPRQPPPRRGSAVVAGMRSAPSLPAGPVPSTWCSNPGGVRLQTLSADARGTERSVRACGRRPRCSFATPSERKLNTEANHKPETSNQGTSEIPTVKVDVSLRRKTRPWQRPRASQLWLPLHFCPVCASPCEHWRARNPAAHQQFPPDSSKSCLVAR